MISEVVMSLVEILSLIISVILLLVVFIPLCIHAEKEDEGSTENRWTRRKW